MGLAFTKEQLDEIQHEGPLMPQHLGAFKIKESFMDMSSSDEELVGPTHRDNFQQNSFQNQSTILPTLESIGQSQDLYQNKL